MNFSSIIKNVTSTFSFSLVNRVCSVKIWSWAGVWEYPVGKWPNTLFWMSVKRIWRRGYRHIASGRTASDLVSSQRHRSKVVQQKSAHYLRGNIDGVQQKENKETCRYVFIILSMCTFHGTYIEIMQCGIAISWWQFVK